MIKRWLGKSQPSQQDIAQAQQRVATGCAGALDNGNPARDHLLARGYCCEKSCRQCPWGYQR